MVRNLTRLLTLCNRFGLRESHVRGTHLCTAFVSATRRPSLHPVAPDWACLRQGAALLLWQKLSPQSWPGWWLTCSRLPIMDCFAGQTYLSMLEQTSRC